MNIQELRAELETLHASSFGWAMSCCRHDRAEAEEVLQTVYLKILEGKARFRGDASFKTWLFAVIRKTAVSEHRKNLLRKFRSAVNPAEASDRTDQGNEVDAAYERSEAQTRFLDALKLLSARQREVLHLAFYEELSLREAAAVMGISIGSARQHYERGKSRLRESLKQTEAIYGISWRGKENPGAV